MTQVRMQEIAPKRGVPKIKIDKKITVPPKKKDFQQISRKRSNPMPPQPPKKKKKLSKTKLHLWRSLDVDHKRELKRVQKKFEENDPPVMAKMREVWRTERARMRKRKYPFAKDPSIKMCVKFTDFVDQLTKSISKENVIACIRVISAFSVWFNYCVEKNFQTIRRVERYLKEPRGLPPTVWNRLQPEFIQIARLANTYAVLIESEILTGLMYAVYDRQDRPTFGGLRGASYAPFGSRPMQPLENEPKDVEELINTKPARRLLYRPRRKNPAAFYQPPSMHGAEPCIFWNWSTCKRKPCASLHVCSGCRRDSHTAKFCPYIDFNYNWGLLGRRQPHQRPYRPVYKDQICLGCGGSHPAKTCEKLIEPVKQMFATLVKRKQVWQHQSHPGDGFFDRRKRWRRQNEERQARMYYSSKQYMADAAGFEFPHNRYFNYPVY